MASVSPFLLNVIVELPVRDGPRKDVMAVPEERNRREP
jgi:hypothetical protein